MAGDLRTRELALIHMARKELGLDDAAYRGLIGRISQGRTESAGDLVESERRDVIRHFRSAGFAAKPKQGGPERGDDAREQAAKLRALWRSLYELGAARDPGDDALAAFVCRHTNKQALRWNSADDLHLAIQCLRGWCGRIGYQPAPSKMEGECKGRFEPALIRAQWARLATLGAFKNDFARLDTWLFNQGWHVADPGFLAQADAKQAVARLGLWLRRVAAQRPDAGDGGDA